MDQTKAEDIKKRCHYPLDHRKSKIIPETKQNKTTTKNPSTSALLTTTTPLTVWITKNCGKFFERCEYQTMLPDS